MGEYIISTRNAINKIIYKQIFKRIFFLIDPETVHDKMIATGQFLGKTPIAQKITASLFAYKNKKLEQKILGIKFDNPVGLAAGFDKNAQLTDILPSVGFGFAGVGSITGESCIGNPKPRLWRLKKSKGLVVYYGLKNDGSEVLSERLKNKKFKIPIAISIAKTNNQETVDEKKGIADYVKAYKKLVNIGSFSVINISCPNAFGGLPFSDPKKLDKLLKEITKIKTKKPVFLKLPPDLPKENIEEIIKVSKRYKIQGFVCTNLTKDRKKMKKKIFDSNVPEKGGISGKVVEDLSNDLINYLYKKTKGEFIIIGCGGIFSAEDAYKKIKSGASLVQLITGMVFEGPQVISEINQGLVKLLERDGYKNIKDAIGKDNKWQK